MKKEYISAELTFIEFEKKDIITGSLSPNNYAPPGEEEGTPDQQ